MCDLNSCKLSGNKRSDLLEHPWRVFLDTDFESCFNGNLNVEYNIKSSLNLLLLQFRPELIIRSDLIQLQYNLYEVPGRKINSVCWFKPSLCLLRQRRPQEFYVEHLAVKFEEIWWGTIWGPILITSILTKPSLSLINVRTALDCPGQQKQDGMERKSGICYCGPDTENVLNVLNWVAKG